MVPKVKVICGVCDKVFEKWPSQLKNGQGKYCSRSCSTVARFKGSVLSCSMCDKKFYRGFYEQSGDNQFCTRKCYDEWRTDNSKSTKTYRKSGGVHVHRTVAESVTGRKLLSGEVVHHVDEDCKNNNPFNLAVFPNQSLHLRCHMGSMHAEELSGYMLVRRGEDGQLP